MSEDHRLSRRSALKVVGGAGAAALMGGFEVARLGTGVDGVRSYAAFRCSVGRAAQDVLSFRSPDFVFVYLAIRSNCVSSVS